jgi:hypothetical protein
VTEQHVSPLNGPLVPVLDRFVAVGPDGAGPTTTVLHDRTGSVSRSEQLLTVRPLT